MYIATFHKSNITSYDSPNNIYILVVSGFVKGIMTNEILVTKYILYNEVKDNYEEVMIIKE